MDNKQVNKRISDGNDCNEEKQSAGCYSRLRKKVSQG